MLVSGGGTKSLQAPFDLVELVKGEVHHKLDGSAAGRDRLRSDPAVNATGTIGFGLQDGSGLVFRQGLIVEVQDGGELNLDSTLIDVGDNGLRRGEESGRGGAGRGRLRSGAAQRDDKGQQKDKAFHAGHGNKPRGCARLHWPAPSPVARLPNVRSAR